MESKSSKPMTEEKEINLLKELIEQRNLIINDLCFRVRNMRQLNEDDHTRIEELENKILFKKHD